MEAGSIFLISVITYIGTFIMWSNWIFLAKDGYFLEPRPSFLCWLKMAFINAWRILTVRAVIPFHTLPQYIRKEDELN